jgi:uncharacterized protein YggE
MVIKKNTKEVSEVKKYLELNSILKIVSILFILSITVLAIVNIFDGKEGGVKDQNLISVSGHGEISVKPDTTKFTISVTETGKDMKSSQDAAKNKINGAIAILKQNGVPEKNIKNLNYNTYPKYSSRTTACAPVSVSAPAVVKNGVKSTVTPKASSTKVATTAPACTEKTTEIVGYETNQSIEVKITDISKNPDLAGILIVAVGAIGVQTSEVTNFVDNIDLSKQYAREQAIQKAKTQARDIANSLGVRLSKITSFSENTNGGYPYAMMNAKSMEVSDSASVNLPVGENKITSDVTITYSIR